MLPEDTCQTRTLGCLSPIKVKSAYEPSGPSGRAYLWFQWHEATRSISTPLGWDASALQGYPLVLNLPVPIFYPGGKRHCPQP